MDSNLAKAVSGLHCLIGCNTMSCFAEKEKLSAFKIVKSSTKFQEAFQRLEMNFHLEVDLFSILEDFTCISLQHKS